MGRSGIPLQRKCAAANLVSMAVTCAVLILLPRFTDNGLQAAAAGIILMVLSTAVVYVVIGQVTGPLSELRKRLADMAEGDYTSAVPEFQGPAEVAELSAAMELLRREQQSHAADLRRVLDSIAANNLNVEPSRAYPGDYRPQREALENITSRLNASLLRIHESTAQIAAAADQLSNGVQTVSRGAVEQSETVQELSQDIGGVYERIRKNAEDAVRATDLSMEAGGVMMQGGQRLGEMMQAMEEISETSKKIGKVIKTVDDIAFQTNILALNASVEAARAGSAGKGFAVVAGEVRNLANKSAEASKGTSGLIESALRAIESGTGIARETAHVFEEVMTKAKTATELTSGIAAAIQREEHALEEMKTDVERISQVVHENASTAEEGAAASEELTGQVHMLREMAEMFQLRNMPAQLR